jgi:hypothetical protein
VACCKELLTQRVHEAPHRRQGAVVASRAAQRTLVIAVEVGPAATGLLVLLALGLFGFWQPRPALLPVHPARWLRQSLLAALGSAAVLLAP